MMTTIWLLWKSNPDTVFTALKTSITLGLTGTQTHKRMKLHLVLHPEKLIIVLLILFANRLGLSFER